MDQDSPAWFVLFHDNWDLDCGGSSVWRWMRQLNQIHVSRASVLLHVAYVGAVMSNIVPSSAWLACGLIRLKAGGWKASLFFYTKSDVRGVRFLTPWLAFLSERFPRSRGRGCQYLKAWALSHKACQIQGAGTWTPALSGRRICGHL